MTKRLLFESVSRRQHDRHKCIPIWCVVTSSSAAVTAVAAATAASAKLHAMETSSPWWQLWFSSPLCAHLSNEVSLPLHLILSSQIFPVPAPYRLLSHLPPNLQEHNTIRPITNKKLSYRRDSAGRRSLRRPRSFKVTDFGTNPYARMRLPILVSCLYPITYRLPDIAQCWTNYRFSHGVPLYNELVLRNLWEYRHK